MLNDRPEPLGWLLCVYLPQEYDFPLIILHEDEPIPQTEESYAGQLRLLEAAEQFFVQRGSLPPRPSGATQSSLWGGSRRIQPALARDWPTAEGSETVMVRAGVELVLYLPLFDKDREDFEAALQQAIPGVLFEWEPVRYERAYNNDTWALVEAPDPDKDFWREP